MIDLDTSVALARLLVEPRRPPESLWEQSIVSSRLLEYEVWTRLNSRQLGHSHGSEARRLLGRIAFVELTPAVLARALQPFPVPVRTLDALHLATIAFLRADGGRSSLQATTPACWTRRTRWESRSTGDEPFACPSPHSITSSACCARTGAPLDERLHVSRRNQPHLVPQLGDLACPVVSARARLHGNKTARLRGEEGEHLIAPQPLAEQDVPGTRSWPDPIRSC